MSVSDSTAGCNNPNRSPTLVDYLADAGLMAYGQSPSDLSALTDRNHDRVRILKYVANHPEGVQQTVLVHEVLKGADPTTYYGYPSLSGDAYDRYDAWADRYYNGSGYTALDGSDDDYQFANRFLNELEDSTALVRFETSADGDTGNRWVFPTLDLLDLISSGITQTPTQPNELVYDKEFCLNLLKSTRSRLLGLPEFAKDVFAKSLRRYIRRVRDYRLAFDVRMVDRTGMDVRRMYKPYATRFTDDGRRDRTFARLQDALDWAADHAETAVFTTLTTDPKKFDSLYDAIMAIYENFNALNSYLATDSATKGDTRKPGIAAWSGPDCGSTGRPRRRLEYIKVLEFSEKGYPHLHVLYIDPPRRETDGMPWLIDKNELSHQWNKDTGTRTGQGRIVDTYPLVYRDDLDHLDVEFNAEEGFVSWYRYGDHTHDADWVESRVRFHQEQGQIDFDGKADNPQQKTAGSYLGKYLSKMYETLVELDANLDDLDHDADAAHWKLGLYWATERRFWSPSRRIRDEIKLEEDRSDIRCGVADCTATSLMQHYEPHASYPERTRERSYHWIYRLSRDLVAQAELDARDAGQTQTTLAHVDYLGAYHYDDLPAQPESPINPDAFEGNLHDPDEPLELASLGDRPPPIVQAFDAA